MGKRNKLDNLLAFLEFTHKLQQVERTILVRDTKRQENDAEHSFQLALVAWFLMEEDNLDLNRDKVIKLAMVHDLIEVYAGDTDLYGDQQSLKTKPERERKALEQLKRDFPRLKDVHLLIEEYEKKGSAESRFVYALDKLLPVLNIYQDKGRNWLRQGVNLKMIRAAKDAKIALDQDVDNYYRQILSLLARRPEFFG